MLQPSVRRALSIARLLSSLMCSRGMRPSARSTEATEQRPSAITLSLAASSAGSSVETLLGFAEAQVRSEERVERGCKRRRNRANR